MSSANRSHRGLRAAVLLLALLPLASASAQDADRRIPGELIVHLAPGADVAGLVAAPSLRAEGLTAKRLLVPALNIWLVGFDDAPGAEASALATLDAVQRAPGVLVAQFNHAVSLRSAVTTPNDTRFGEMWGLNNTGQSGGTPDADVDAPEAWDLNTGGLSAAGDRVAVGIVDSGFDLNHPDLRFWTNTAEVPGNSLDDDGNGYVDDVNGWNAYNHNGTITSSTHGTHVAGTAAARGNNGLGTTGINWNAETVAIQGSSGNEATVVEAYGYALALRTQYNATNGAQGAFVVSTNSSFGVDFGQPANYPIWCGMYDTMGAAGILSAAATANQNTNIDVVGDIPTACPSDYMIAVTNTTRDDQKNSGAAYGLTTIDLGAPGTSILSTTPGSNYSTLTGTSMATPHVTGAVALLVSALDGAQLQNYRDNPASAALALKQAILDGTDDIGIQTVTGGRLNLYNSLLLLDQAPAVAAGLERVGTAPIPASGGTLTYHATLTNTTGQSQTVTAVVEATLPNGNPYGAIQGPRTVTLNPNQTVGPLTFNRSVPAAAPAGTYTVTLRLSIGGTEITSDSFTFDKAASAVAAQAEARVGAVGVSPNPFRGATTIRFALGEAAPVRLAVYDVLGREVAVLVDGPLEAGAHAPVFDAAGLANGTYLYRLSVGEVVQTGRLQLLK